MLKKVLGVCFVLLCLSVFHPAQAQTVCVNGSSGAPPTASISFTIPSLNTDGTPIVGPLTYNLYQATTSGSETKVASALKGSPITVTTGLAPKTTVYFKISVTDANGQESALSNEVCKTFPASVPGTVTITIS